MSTQNKKVPCTNQTCSIINVEFPAPSLQKLVKSDKQKKKRSTELSEGPFPGTSSESKPKSSLGSDIGSDLFIPVSKNQSKDVAATTTSTQFVRETSKESISGEESCLCNLFPCNKLLLSENEKDQRRLNAPTISEELLLSVDSTSFLEKGFGMKNVSSFTQAIQKTAKHGTGKDQTDDSILTSGFGLKSIKSLQEALAAKRSHYDKDVCKGFGMKKLESLEKMIRKEERKQKELLQSIKEQDTSPYQDMPLRSLLRTGFGLRDTDSLEQAILQEKYAKKIAESQQTEGEYEEEMSYDMEEPIITLATSSQTTDISTTPEKKLKYYMKQITCEDGVEEIEGKRAVVGKELFPLSASMKKAQRYLRLHRIFELFHFLIAHLISKRPENPIDFLMDLLNKCLLYRSGLMPPPLLYERPHLEILFDMMDPMHTGHIDLEQYKTAMKTLGICSFNKRPQMTAQKTVSKMIFVEEAYSCLIDLLNDLIRRRWNLPYRTSSPLDLENPPPTVASYEIDLSHSDA